MPSAANPALLGARPLRDALYGEPAWRRPGFFSRELLLESGSEVLASLRWEKLLSFEAVAESADGRWIIGRRRGSLLGEILVRGPDVQEPVATFTRGWRRTGEVRFASGPRFKWEREGFWRPEWFWSSDEAARLVTYTWRVGWQSRYEMGVDPAALRLEELPVLALLGGYLMALISQQNAMH